jgi:hypothetical protein
MPNSLGWLHLAWDIWSRPSSAGECFASSTELAAALQRAAAAQGEHAKRTGEHDANWPAWYAEYIVREQGGQQLPS